MFIRGFITSLFELWGLNDGFSDSQEVVFAEFVFQRSKGGGQATAETGRLSGIGSLKKS